MILLLHTIPRHIHGNIRRRQQRRQIKSLGLPVIDRFGNLQLVDTPHHFVDRPKAKLCHELPCFFGHEEEVVDDMFRLAVELLA